MLRQLGIVGFPSHYIVRTRSGRIVDMPLADEHYFTAALTWAEGLFAQAPADRALSLDAWNTVVGRSAEMNAVNNMLENHGSDAWRAPVVSMTVLSGITAEEIIASRPRASRSRPWWRFW